MKKNDEMQKLVKLHYNTGRRALRLKDGMRHFTNNYVFHLDNLVFETPHLYHSFIYYCLRVVMDDNATLAQIRMVINDIYRLFIDFDFEFAQKDLGHGN